MNKLHVPVLNLDYYSEVLPNGLNVVVCPNPNTVETSVFYMTKYGDYYNYFKTDEYRKHSLGLAHFLEHKMFEQRNGDNAFDFFTKHALYCNAFTFERGTVYVFETNKELKTNIEYLLDMVDDLYLTEANVAKEKGIILSEQRMRADENNRLIRSARESMIYKNHPVNNVVFGSPDDIKGITKKELEDVYNTFYVPNNMQLLVVGNVVPEEIIKIAKDNQAKKKRASKIINVKKYTEESSMAMKENTVKTFVNIPKTSCIYKIMLPKEYVNNAITGYYADYLVFILESKMHGYNEELHRDGVISTLMSVGFNIVDNILTFYVTAVVPNEKLFAEVIYDKLKTLDKDYDDYDYFKQKEVCGMIKQSDSNDFISNQLMNDYFDLDCIDELEYQHFKDTTHDDFLKFYHSLSFKEHGILHIVPKDKGEQ